MKIIIIGCTHAGLIAAKEALKYHPEIEITIYERNANVSFMSSGIYLYLSNEISSLNSILSETPENLSKAGANIKTNHDVLKVNRKDKTVIVEDLNSHHQFTDHYDKLVVTTGSRAILPPVKGIDSFRVQVCKTLEQAQLIKKYAQTSQRIAIVGGGYSGVEIAEAYAHTDHQVTLIQDGPQLLTNYIDIETSESIIASLRSHNIDVRLNSRVSSFETIQEGKKVKILTNKEAIMADFVIACTGFQPNADLLANQVELNRDGTILTNAWQETSDPDILAAGDVCATMVNPAKTSEYVSLASNAVRQGYAVGHNLFGHHYKVRGTQMTTALRFFQHTLATSGLTLARAQEYGFKAHSVTYHGLYRPCFMPSNVKIDITLVYDTETRKILGAQLFGNLDLSQSANTISVCIENNNTIDDLAGVDMLFNPQFDQPFHYLNQVAQLAIDTESNRNLQN